MRVALVTQNYPPLVNGQSTFVAGLARGLAGLGHDVLVVCPSAMPRRRSSRSGRVRIERLAGVPLTPGRPRVPLAVRPGPAVHALFDEFRPDVVHLQDHYPVCRSALGDAHARGLPVIATNHFLPRNLTAHVPIPAAVRPMVETVLWRNARDVYARAAAVTAPTATAVALLREGCGVDARPISCGVDIERFGPARSTGPGALARPLGLPADVPIALYVGRLDADKRVEVVIDAMTRVGHPRLHLAIVGRGPRERDLRRRCVLLGLGSRVTFLGFVPQSRLPALLASADIFVMPGESELQSIATLEALASGLPVIAANAGALPELVFPGVTGVLFPPGDAAAAAACLDSLASDGELRDRMGRAGRALAERHDRRATYAAYAGLYAEVVADPAARYSDSNAGPLSHASTDTGAG